MPDSLSLSLAPALLCSAPAHVFLLGRSHVEFITFIFTFSNLLSSSSRLVYLASFPHGTFFFLHTRVCICRFPPPLGCRVDTLHCHSAIRRRAHTKSGPAATSEQAPSKNKTTVSLHPLSSAVRAFLGNRSTSKIREDHDSLNPKIQKSRNPARRNNPLSDGQHFFSLQSGIRAKKKMFTLFTPLSASWASHTHTHHRTKLSPSPHWGTPEEPPPPDEKPSRHRRYRKLNAKIDTVADWHQSFIRAKYLVRGGEPHPETER